MRTTLFDGSVDIICLCTWSDERIIIGTRIRIQVSTKINGEKKDDNSHVSPRSRCIQCVPGGLNAVNVRKLPSGRRLTTTPQIPRYVARRSCSEVLFRLRRTRCVCSNNDGNDRMEDRTGNRKSRNQRANNSDNRRVNVVKRFYSSR